MRHPLTLCFALLIPLAAAAAPTDPIVLEVPDAALGDPHVVGLRTLADVPQAYVEEELFVSGNATVYTYEEQPRRKVVLPRDLDVPYKTRLMVRRPADPRKFRGTVVVEWWNSTASFDSAPVWDASAEFFAREGWIYVGVTNSNTPIAFLKGGCRLGGVLPVANCRQRYATLSLPENGQAYELMSQIAHALKQGGAGGPLPAEYRVRRLFHAGQSQQGGSVITYATAFHFPANDGYFVQTFSTARAINFGPVCGAAGAPAYPDCTPALQGRERLVRTDLPVPVYQAMTETDMEIGFGVIANDARQRDTRTYRYYEMAGTAHTGVHKDVDVVPNLLTLEQACFNPLNTHADGPVFGAYLLNAMWKNMELQARFRLPPPRGRGMAVVDGVVARDAFGNARGGVRLPELDLPVATYSPNNEVDVDNIPGILLPALPLLNLFCVLSGSVFPFDDATLASLYPSADHFVARYRHRLIQLLWQRFLLWEDAKKLDEALVPPVP
jgi:Alpha/beta hydrolase domain